WPGTVSRRETDREIRCAKQGTTVAHAIVMRRWWPLVCASRSRRRLALAVAMVSVAAWSAPACSSARIEPSSSTSQTAPGDGSFRGAIPVRPAPAGDEETAPIAPSLDAPLLDDADASVAEAPAGDDATDEALPDGACAQPPGAGSLRIDELMIASVAGTGDSG